MCYNEVQPIARADLLIHGEWAMIEDLVVIPSRQRQGFGTFMLHTLIDEALRRGAYKILLIADADDTAKELYKKIGFVEHRGRTSLLFRW